MSFPREDYEHTAKLLRSSGEQAVKATLSNNYNIILAALDQAAMCCHSTPEPMPWKAALDNSADAQMVRQMYRIRHELSYRTPLRDFIWMLKAAVHIDSRTMMGGDIQRCLLSNAAARLELLSERIDPWPWASLTWRLRDAWAVIRRRSVALAIRA